jgi:membrane protein
MPQASTTKLETRPGFFRQIAHMAMLCSIGIKRSQLTRMAAALSYRTIFGLIPILVVGLVFTATFAKEEQIRGWIESVLQFAGLSQIAVAPTPDVGPSPGTSGRLDEWIADMVNHVRGLKWELVGFLGLGTLIYAAISMLVEIEEAFNQIYNAPSGRSWTRRVTQYWTLLTLGSLFLVGSFSIPAQLESYVNKAMTYAREAVGMTDDHAALVPPPGPAATEAPRPHEPAAVPASTSTEVAGATASLPPEKTWTGKLIGAMFSVGVSCALFLTIFCVVPNTRVQVGPASVGAFVTAGLWELAKQGFAMYVSASKGYTTLYGALALLPMFLIWVYLTWIIVLFGLHVAHAMQAYRTATRQGLSQSVMVALGLLVEQHSSDRPNRSVDPSAMVLIMSVVGERFAQGKPTDHAHVADRTGLDEPTVVQMLERLAAAGLLHRVAVGGVDDAAFVLARPAQAITLSEILELAHESSDRIKSPAAIKLLETLAKARHEAVAGRTLADALA